MHAVTLTISLYLTIFQGHHQLEDLKCFRICERLGSQGPARNGCGDKGMEREEVYEHCRNYHLRGFLVGKDATLGQHEP